MLKSFLRTASVAPFLVLCSVSPVFAADDAMMQKLSAMIEQQQKVLDAQAKELSSMRSELANLKTSQQTQAKAVAAINPAAGAAPVTTTAKSDQKFVEVGDFPGSIKMPGTNVSIKLGGQVKADMLYTFNQTSGLSEDLFQTRTISATGGAESGRFRAHARETRLNLDVRAPTDYGDLKAFTEFDLFGGSSATFPQEQVNGYEIRLRHAYVQVGQFLVGQTWSTFNDPASFAETLDFAQVNGESFVRQPQARWTSKPVSGFNFSVAAENPEGDISDNTAPGTGRRTNSDNMPDLIGNVRYEQGWGHLQAGALYRQLKIEGDATDPTFNDTASGYGVNLSGKIKTPVINEKDNLKFQVNYGEGIGRYINDLQLTGTETFDAAIDAGNDSIDPLEAMGGYVSYQMVFSDKWRSNLTGGYVYVDQPGYQPATAMESTKYGAANLIWSPVSKLDLGIEFLYGERKNNDGNEGDASRVQGSVRYMF